MSDSRWNTMVTESNDTLQLTETKETLEAPQTYKPLKAVSRCWTQNRACPDPLGHILLGSWKLLWPASREGYWFLFNKWQWGDISSQQRSNRCNITSVAISTITFSPVFSLRSIFLKQVKIFQHYFSINMLTLYSKVQYV